MKYAKYDVYVKICTICNCYIVTYSTYFAYAFMQNITNMNPALFFFILFIILIIYIDIFSYIISHILHIIWHILHI